MEATVSSKTLVTAYRTTQRASYGPEDYRPNLKENFAVDSVFRYFLMDNFEHISFFVSRGSSATIVSS
jgi:hypothetical protein